MSCCPNQTLLPLVESCDGVRELATSETLLVWSKVVSTSLSVTLKDLPQVVLTSDDADITLPKPSKPGVIIIVKVTSGESDVIAPAGMQVEGGSNITLASGESATLVSDGSNWWVI